MVVIEALLWRSFIIVARAQLVPRFTAGFCGQPRRVASSASGQVPRRRDQARPQRAIVGTLRCCRWPLVFVPPWVDDPYNFETPFYHSSEIFAYAMKALSKKLAAMGLDPAMLAEPAGAGA
jgi:hypothetical protein